MKSSTSVISTSLPGQYPSLYFYANLVKFLDKLYTCDEVINVNNLEKAYTLQSSLFQILTVVYSFLLLFSTQRPKGPLPLFRRTSHVSIFS